ncbi:GntR family transcriptional regulator [Sodalis ligni]|jgi:DNA-binding GntR family transcriptional regulator|uniref:DNA-binding GntR family transcriptional regulator n=1 Tax=Sodalis ligni TaxID=2697027 RepID=A0A4R1N6Z5_9GAMM|nr:GntR family transcriptional regulator [Sodalis ligni]QWA13421.1 GntR family transcriptional regulator [Sodalis ligni]TCL02902.1 DNA-binding GntR family transcriptional regulator [Sodalis ligni]
MIERVHTFLTKSELAYQTLLSAIQSGELKPGQKVTLNELAARLGMSLTPVRDAFTLLAEQGLIERTPHHAAVIAKKKPSRSEEVSLLRAILEPEAVRLAAMYANPAQIDEIAEAYQASLDAAKNQNARELSKYNELFHLKIAEASGSSFLIEFISSLWKALPAQGMKLYDNAPAILKSHADILTAIRDGKPDEASALMAGHVGHAADRAREYFDRLRQSDSEPEKDA